MGGSWVFEPNRSLYVYMRYHSVDVWWKTKDKFWKICSNWSWSGIINNKSEVDAIEICTSLLFYLLRAYNKMKYLVDALHLLNLQEMTVEYESRHIYIFVNPHHVRRTSYGHVRSTDEIISPRILILFHYLLDRLTIIF